MLRLDSATEFAVVGWAADLPPGRFIHIDTLCETDDCEPLSKQNPCFKQYTTACRRAQQINLPLLQKQEEIFLANGCLPVPMNLHDQNANVSPDDFGCYHVAAMQTMFKLTANIPSVWAVINTNTITHIQADQPPKSMEELEYQVWKHHCLNQLSQYPGEIHSGKLMVQESGLWFCPIK